MQFQSKVTPKNAIRLMATHVVLKHSALLRSEADGSVDVCIVDPQTGKHSWAPYGSSLPVDAIKLREPVELEPGSIVLYGDQMMYVHDVVSGRVIVSPDKNSAPEQMRVVNRDVVQTWYDFCYSFAEMIGEYANNRSSSRNEPSKRAVNDARGKLLKEINELVDAHLRTPEFIAKISAAKIIGIKIELIDTMSDLPEEAQREIAQAALDSLDDDTPCDCPACRMERARNE